jgi:hypothetical protein
MQTHEAVHGVVGSERQRLEELYRKVYRNPEDASARFTFLKVQLGIEAASDRIARDPGILGALQGGWLTASSRKDRAQALRSGGQIVDGEQTLRRAEDEAWHYQKVADEQRRRQAAIEVPGLSPKAQAAVRALADCEIRRDWTPPELSKHRNPTPEWILAMKKCAKLYEAILADDALLAELNRFEKAAGDRLAYVGRVGSARSRQVSDEERQARRLLGVVVAARALHAWYPVLRNHVASHPALKLQVEQAEFMLRMNSDRMRQSPGRGPDLKPSPRPSFGPGM